MEERQQRQVFGLVLPFLLADRDGVVGVLLHVAAVSRTLRGLVAEDERLWRTLHLARTRSSPTPAVAFHHSWLRSFWCHHTPQSAEGVQKVPASLLQAAPSTALLAEAHATRKLGKLPTRGDKEADADDDGLQVALVAVADFNQHEREEGTPALIVDWPDASSHPFSGCPVHDAHDWPLTLSPDVSAFARDGCFVPSPSYACFRDTGHRVPADGQGCTLMMTRRDFVHYAEHNRDEKPLCVVHDLSHIRTSTPRNMPFPTDDLFDVLDKRPPKDFLCIEPTGGGAAWHQPPYGQSVLDLLVEGSRRWSFYPPAYRPPGVQFHLSEEEEEASEVVSPYTTPPALRWLQDVYPNLTDDDYQPIECIQNAGQALFVPAGWWTASVSVGQSTSISLRSHYASATQLDELCSTLPPPLLVRLKNRLWDCKRPDLVQQIDCCMGTPGRLEVVQVLRKIAHLLHSRSSATDCAVTDRVDRARLPTFNDKDGLSGIVEAQRHSHLNPTFVVENRLVIKFYHRRALGHHHRESALLRYFASLPAGAWETPRLPVLYAQGALKRERGATNVEEAEEDGDEDEDRVWEWPYLVVSYVEGETLEAAWDRMAAADKEAMASDLGRLTAFVHAMPLPTSPLRLGQPSPPNDTYRGGERLPDSWDAFVHFMQTQRRNCVQQHRQWGSLPPHLLAQLEDYLPPLDTLASFLSASAAPPPNDAAASVWLHSDLTATNLIMRAAGRCAAVDSVPAWEVVGLIDFGDAKVGHRVYDFVALHVLVFRCDKPLLRRFFLAYGGTNQLPSHGFAYTAMCLSLLHEHDIVGAIARMVPDFAPSLHQLATLLWEYET